MIKLVQTKGLLLHYFNIASGNMKYKRMKIQRLQFVKKILDLIAKQNQLLGSSHFGGGVGVEWVECLLGKRKKSLRERRAVPNHSGDQIEREEQVLICLPLYYSPKSKIYYDIFSSRSLKMSQHSPARDWPRNHPTTTSCHQTCTVTPALQVSSSSLLHSSFLPSFPSF